MVEYPSGDNFQEIQRARQVTAVALGPAMRLVVPLDRHRRVAPGNAAIDEDRQQTIELDRAPEQPLDPFDDLFLAERMRRHGGGESQQARRERHRTAPLNWHAA